MLDIEELIPFRFPIGFQFVLFEVKKKGNKRYVTADTVERASALAFRDSSKSRTKLVNVKDLIDDMGHNQTHKLLKRFGEDWITKGGRVFYRFGPQAF